MAQIEIIVGSVYGNAQNVAEHAEQFLISARHQVNVHTDPDIDLLNEDGRVFEGTGLPEGFGHP